MPWPNANVDWQSQLSSSSNNMWDPVHHDVFWEEYHNETEFCTIKLVNDDDKVQSIKLIGSSRKDRQYNCAKVYQYCVENFVNRQNCAKASNVVIKHVEQKGCGNNDTKSSNGLSG